MATRNYQTYMGPSDPNLRHSEIEGYQPVSRIGLCLNLNMSPIRTHRDSLTCCHAQARS